MKKVFYILIFMSFLLFSPLVLAQTATQKACQKVMRAPEVSFSVSYGKLKYDFSKNDRTLTRMHIKQYGGQVPSGNYVNGLATFTLSTSLNMKLSKTTLRNGTVCIYPSKLDLKVKNENPTIYISSDLKENTCRYKVALRHEQTHQQINVEIFEYYIPIIKRRFEEAISQYALISSKHDINLTLAQEKFQDKYVSTVNQVIEEITAEINTEQAKIDSVENYGYETSLCD